MAAMELFCASVLSDGPPRRCDFWVLRVVLTCVIKEARIGKHGGLSWRPSWFLASGHKIVSRLRFHRDPPRVFFFSVTTGDFTGLAFFRRVWTLLRVLWRCLPISVTSIRSWIPDPAGRDGLLQQPKQERTKDKGRNAARAHENKKRNEAE